MSLKENLLNELKGSPIASITGNSGVVLAALALLIAWSQYQDGTPSTMTLNNESSPTQSEIHLGNLFLIIGYFIALTISTAFLVRALARKHDIAAFVFSIPIAALTNFSTILIVYIAPPRALSQDSFSSAHDLLLYAAAVVYVAFCGLPVLRDIASPSKEETDDTKKSPDALAALFFSFIILAIWCSLVFSGQNG